MYADCFIVYTHKKDIYKDIGEDAETRFHNWNYELERSLAKGKKVKK